MLSLWVLSRQRRYSDKEYYFNKSAITATMSAISAKCWVKASAVQFSMIICRHGLAQMYSLMRITLVTHRCDLQHIANLHDLMLGCLSPSAADAGCGAVPGSPIVPPARETKEISTISAGTDWCNEYCRFFRYSSIHVIFFIIPHQWRPSRTPLWQNKKEARDQSRTWLKYEPVDEQSFNSIISDHSPRLLAQCSGSDWKCPAIPILTVTKSPAWTKKALSTPDTDRLPFQEKVLLQQRKLFQTEEGEVSMKSHIVMSSSGQQTMSFLGFQMARWWQNHWERLKAYSRR